MDDEFITKLLDVIEKTVENQREIQETLGGYDKTESPDLMLPEEPVYIMDTVEDLRGEIDVE